MSRIIRSILPLALLIPCSCSGSETEAAAGGYDNVSTSEIGDANLNKVMQLQKEMVADTVEVLESVKDIESAKVAKQKLEAIAKRAIPLRERLEELKGGTAEDKLALAQSALGMMGEINAMGHEFQRIEGIEGVRDVLQTAMDKIFEMFRPQGN